MGENVYISTNVSETPQIVRAVNTGEVDVRASAALTASKVTSALNAGADVVKVGFANMDTFKRDLRSSGVLEHMKLVRKMVDDVVREGLLVYPLGETEGRYPLVSVFFPELGIDSFGERPMDVAWKGLDLTRKARWQGMLIDTFEKYTGKRYVDFYTLEDTRALAKAAHRAGMEFVDRRVDPPRGGRRLSRVRRRPGLLRRCRAARDRTSSAGEGRPPRRVDQARTGRAPRRGVRPRRSEAVQGVGMMRVGPR